jgi:DNA-binding NtrC family response regulator
MPALREHKLDIPLLCDSFIAKLNEKTGKNIRKLSPEAKSHLMNYFWPGNIRQLENAIEHAFVMCFGDTINLEELPDEIKSDWSGAVRLPTEKKQSVPTQKPRGFVTREQLLDVLEQCRWNKSEAARQLGVDRTTIWRKMKKLGIQPPL